MRPQTPIQPNGCSLTLLACEMRFAAEKKKERASEQRFYSPRRISSRVSLANRNSAARSSVTGYKSAREFNSLSEIMSPRHSPS